MCKTLRRNSTYKTTRVGNRRSNNSFYGHTYNNVLAPGVIALSGASVLLTSYCFAAEGEVDNAMAFDDKSKENLDVILEAETVAEENVCKVNNTILADRHRVSLCGSTIRSARDNKDPRVKDIETLFEHVWQAGYDGIEISVEDLRSMYPKASKKITSIEFANMLKNTRDAKLMLYRKGKPARIETELMRVRSKL